MSASLKFATNIVKSDPFGLLKSFPVIIKQPLQWGDQDPFGHLNNVMFLRYLETSRIAYMIELFDYKKMLEEERIGPILYQVNCKYLGQVLYPDTLYVGTSVPIESIRDRSYVMKHMMVSEATQKVVAEAEIVIVSFDYKKNEKTKHPQILIDRIKEIESQIEKI